MKDKKLRVFEAFAGIGAQHSALERANLNFEIVGISEWFINALDCIVEMGMLIKIFHLGLIDENVFVKTKDDVLKRHSATHSILSLVEG